MEIFKVILEIKNSFTSKRTSEAELWRMMYEILLGLSYLHSNNIIHRDLKPLNIFLTSNQSIKIGDLGVSRIVTSNDYEKNTVSIKNDARVGTPLFLAPELVKQKPYDFKIDIWAVGIIMYYLSTLKLPFLGENLSKLATSITASTPKDPPKIYTDKFRNCILSFLSKNPKERPSADEAIELIPELTK